MDKGGGREGMAGLPLRGGDLVVFLGDLEAPCAVALASVVPMMTMMY